ncbi:MAG: hypothetical protein QM756_44860 [Polyangiaceae bacterium]
MRSVRRWLFGLGLLALGQPGCGNDQSPLAKGSSGGAAGRSGQGGKGTGGAAVLSGGSTVTGTGGRTPDESPGENVLTIVHGVVDAAVIRLCFGKVGVDGALPLGVPEPVAGLDYGAALVLRGIAEVDWASDVQATWVLTGDTQGLDCAAAVAQAETLGDDQGEVAAGGSGGEGGGPASAIAALRAARLPNVPAGTLSQGRSTLLVANGCIGGRGVDSRLSANACGDGYSERAPTLSAVFAALSRRTDPSKLGLQVLNASLASPELDVFAAPASGSPGPSLITLGAELGTLVPRLPALVGAAMDYGVSDPDWGVQLSHGGSQLFSEPWQTIVSHAGLTSLSDGKTYALVVLGPGLGLPLSRTLLWNTSRVAVVPTDP